MSNKLTPREEEILLLSGGGLRAKEVGNKLGISQFTVQSHRRTIYEKLGARGVADALIKHFQFGTKPRKDGHLTPTEVKIVNALITGLSMKDAAINLGMPICTVHTHCGRIMRKVKADTMVQAVAKLAGYEPEVVK